ncbi:hypothetical protein A5747_13315 [Mycobacterium sp. IS-836]|nr:hypothetical protein A5747_13315 [Mycobacterium sp. IS-836]
MENPEQFAAWAFAAGVPDPRGKTLPGKFPNQPMINPNCFAAFSQMLWDLGFRHHEELQTKWVKPGTGPYSNFQTWDLVDAKPVMEQILVEEFPEIAKKLTQVTPENHRQAVKEQTEALQEAFARLQEAQEQAKNHSRHMEVFPTE